MKIERKMIGSGVTKKVRVIRIPESMAELHAIMTEKMGTFLDYIAVLEQQATEYLRKKRLPHTFGMWAKQNGEWKQVSLKTRPIIYPIYSFFRAVTEAEGHAEDSNAGFAAQLIVLIFQLRAANQSNDIVRAMRLSHDIGELTTTSNFKLHWEKSALRGQKVGDAAKVGGTVRSVGYASRDLKIALRHLQLQREHHPKPILTIMAEYSLKQSAAFEAVRRGKKMLRDPAKPD